MTLTYVNDLKVKAALLATDLNDAWGKRHAHPPSVLWHYTSRQGFEGMLINKQMWLTDAKHLNDKSELDHGIGVIKRTLQKMKVRYSSAITQDFLERSSVGIQVTNMITKVYVACFSEPDDLLSQWDRYASWSNGFSLGFRANDLVKGRPHLYLRKVEYEESVQTRLVERVAERFCDLLERELNPSIEWTYNDLVLRAFDDAMMKVFIQHLICFKHRGFREEQEWRVVETLGPVSGASRLLYRKSGSLTVPYVKENLAVRDPTGYKWRLPIAEVYSGPRLRPRAARDYLRRWFYLQGYSPPPVIKASTIPLR